MGRRITPVKDAFGNTNYEIESRREQEHRESGEAAGAVILLFLGVFLLAFAGIRWAFLKLAGPAWTQQPGKPAPTTASRIGALLGVAIVVAIAAIYISKEIQRSHGSPAAQEPAPAAVAPTPAPAAVDVHRTQAVEELRRLQALAPTPAQVLMMAPLQSTVDQALAMTTVPADHPYRTALDQLEVSDRPAPIIDNSFGALQIMLARAGKPGDALRSVASMNTNDANKEAVTAVIRAVWLGGSAVDALNAMAHARDTIPEAFDGIASDLILTAGKQSFVGETMRYKAAAYERMYGPVGSWPSNVVERLRLTAGSDARDEILHASYHWTGPYDMLIQWWTAKPIARPVAIPHAMQDAVAAAWAGVDAQAPKPVPRTKGEFETTAEFNRRVAELDQEFSATQSEFAGEERGRFREMLRLQLSKFANWQLTSLHYDADQQLFRGILLRWDQTVAIPVQLPAPREIAEDVKNALDGKTAIVVWNLSGQHLIASGFEIESPTWTTGGKLSWDTGVDLTKAAAVHYAAVAAAAQQ